MNSRRHSKFVRPQRALARLVSLILLSFIVHGTTVEAVHRHGTIRPVSETGQSVRDANSGDDGISAPSGCGACLICQLQQNFSTGHTNAFHVSPQPIATHHSTQVSALDISSSIVAPRSGRAPPVAS
uniref:DUF2946 domain-containing protein n=1 Tax=uncultured Acidobacteriota bacterium TaxID=171953 RepID=Q7X314_9BACT|nr:hypothetical protein [uncultured Acidobacteriota bacterium]